MGNGRFGTQSRRHHEQTRHQERGIERRMRRRVPRHRLCPTVRRPMMKPQAILTPRFFRSSETSFEQSRQISGQKSLLSRDLAALVPSITQEVRVSVLSGELIGRYHFP
jgi:hypothetical protein